MIFLRSSLFIILVLLVTPPYVLFSSLTFPLPPKTRHRIITSWARVVLWFVWHVLGIHYKVIGKENIPAGPAVILCKHQSAWETMALQSIFPPLCFVLKRELLRIPFLGWGLAQASSIGINRSSGKDALFQIIEQGKTRLKNDFWVAIFPEGTRIPPGKKGQYRAGGAWLAKKAGVPIVPVAHNAGEFWPRNALIKRPGEITVSIGPQISAKGIKADEANKRAEEWIETEMLRLFPYHYLTPLKTTDNPEQSILKNNATKS